MVNDLRTEDRRGTDLSTGSPGVLGLNLAVMASEPRNKVSADCFNDPFVPDEIGPLEKELHKFLDNTSMQELNVSFYM